MGPSLDWYMRRLLVERGRGKAVAESGNYARFLSAANQPTAR